MKLITLILETNLNANPHSSPQSIVAEASFSKGMRFGYELKFFDLVCFSTVHQFLSPVLQGFIIVFTLLTFISGRNEDEVPVAAVSALLLYCGAWIFQFIFNVISLITRKNRTQFTLHTIEITDTSFFEETKYNKSHFFWPGVVKAVSRPGFVAVYVAQNVAHIIPNRAFSSDEQRKKFLALVREMMNTSSAKV
jgi:hypothetical protein